MATYLFVFIALALGFMLYSSIQNQIPDELSMLKGSPVVQSASGAAPATVYKSWEVRQGGGAVELVKRFNAPGNEQTFSNEVPKIGIVCANGKLDMRIDTRLPTTGAKATEVVWAGQSAAWAKGDLNNIFPSDVVKAVNAVGQNKTVDLKLSFVNAGLQGYVLDTKGFSELFSQFPASCR